MIARANPSHLTEAHRQQFLSLLPAIENHARFAFRDSNRDELEDKTAEVVANAYVAFTKLVQQGKADIAYATPLAMYAVRQVREGRRVGTKLNIKDITSPYCQRRKRISVERLDRRDPSGHWREVLVEDKKAGPAETAATRIDFSEWLGKLVGKQRKIAERWPPANRPA